MSVHTGKCLCGAIRFETEGEPRWTAHCHCESCRRQTASVMASFAGFREENFRITEGEPKTYESSPERWRTFCGDCGSPLYYHAKWDPGMVHIFIGVLDEPEAFPAKFQVFCEERLSWFDTADDVPRYRWMSTDGVLME